MLKKIKITLIAFILIAITGKAQNFNYTLSKDSSIYSSLSGATSLSTGEDWSKKKLSIHLPFSFNFCGSTTDSLITIEGNGFMVMNKSKQLSIVSFNNFKSNKDTNQSYTSSIAYLTAGSQGNRITKIEFKNISQNRLSNSDHLNYQIWLYESGNKIEFHIGENSYASQSNLSTGDSTSVYSMPEILGILNRNMDTSTKAYLVSGNPSSPSGQAISGTTDLVYVNNIPYSGTVYTLTPTF